MTYWEWVLAVTPIALVALALGLLAMAVILWIRDSLRKPP